MQAKFTEKMEVHSAYQKMARKCQLMQEELENLTKDKHELQEKYSEKSRQKRKLDELHDQLREEYESAKRSKIHALTCFQKGKRCGAHGLSVWFGDCGNKDMSVSLGDLNCLRRFEPLHLSKTVPLLHMGPKLEASSMSNR